MLSLNLNIKPQTEQKLKTILTYTQDEEMFAQNIIAYQIAELQRAILNLRIDLKEFEEKYKTPSDDFYSKFLQGVEGDNEDFIIWSGLYEMFLENNKKISELKL
ncbi:MAG: hypothetical protein HQK64_13250 [Desulfamplus sp.]|nr:hypothetical protein [Desulfamplus sp.]MBF0243425.1 hypothetical protein [Desulfamplus sp.]